MGREEGGGGIFIGGFVVELFLGFGVLGFLEMLLFRDVFNVIRLKCLFGEGGVCFSFFSF